MFFFHANVLNCALLDILANNDGSRISQSGGVLFLQSFLRKRPENEKKIASSDGERPWSSIGSANAMEF